jgi:hypothetical protein
MPAPRSDFPAETIAQLLGLTPRRLQQLAAEGFIPRSERGLYPLVGAVQGYIRYLKEHSREANRSSEHQRLARAQAVKVEMENYRRAGESVLREQVFELLMKLSAEVVGALEGIPGRTANEYAASQDPAFIRQRQQDELRAVRSILADTLEQFAQSLEDRAEYGEGAQAAAPASAEPVGERVPQATTD